MLASVAVLVHLSLTTTDLVSLIAPRATLDSLASFLFPIVQASMIWNITSMYFATQMPNSEYQTSGYLLYTC
jgi:hypothetical protein